MQCTHHPGTAAVSSCSTCGEWLCHACALDISGNTFCRICLTRMASEPVPPVAPPPPRFHRRPSSGLTFILSFFPGVNYMYLGLMKRGLAAMCAFFLNIYALTLVSGSFIGGPLTLLLWLALPVGYLSFMFDGFIIRRRIVAGEVVPDNIDDVIGFIRRNKRPLLIMLALCVGLGVATSILSVILRPFLNLIPLVIIGLILYIAFKSMKAKT